MGNAVVHFEIGAADDGQLVAFYAELFGWGPQPLAGGGYTLVDTRGGSGINGGIGKSRTGEPWATFYVETDDPQATLDKANSLGAATVLPVTDFGGAVTIAMFSDPDGLLVGLVRAAAHPAQADPPGPSAGTGAAVYWFEVMGSDPARTQRFYADLFGWQIDSTFPGYATTDTGTERGIQGGLGGGVEGRWATIYALVDDIEQTLGKAERLGGSRILGTGAPELKRAARAALYGDAYPDDHLLTELLRDPAGNILGLFNR